MSTGGIRALATIGVLISLPTGVAVAHAIGGSPTPPKITVYKGSDPVGTVSFKLYKYSGPPAPTFRINNFHFANKCSATGTTVRATIRVGPKHGFSFDNATTGIAVSGSLHLRGVRNAHDAPPPALLRRVRRGAAPARERRLVSVLFCDLVGFTTFSESRDAEDVRDVLDQYFAAARRIVSEYGGTIEKFIGDAVMAVWGAPLAREDDAERAVRSGLEIVQAVGSLAERLAIPELRVRVGVLTGEAAVEVGSAHEGTVTGDAVDTAARIQSIAEVAPGLRVRAARRSRRCADSRAPGPVGELWRGDRLERAGGGRPDGPWDRAQRPGRASARNDRAGPARAVRK